MAESYYGLGQYRSNNSTNYLTPITTTSSYQNNGTSYRDVVIERTGNTTVFEKGKNYLLQLKLPKNRAYDTKVKIKLGLKDDNSQFLQIRQIIVPRDSENALEISKICLYKIENKDYVGIVRSSINDCESYDVIQDTEEVFYKDPSSGATQLQNDYLFQEIVQRFNNAENIESSFASFNIVFSPKIDNIQFDKIILEIIREDYDQDINYTIDNIAYKGRYFNINNSSLYNASLYEIVDLLNNNIIPNKPLTHIGVWSHPELMLAINGEEIMIGRSGFYEIDDYEITSLGVAAKQPTEQNPNINDKFVIDYQYPLSNS